LFINKLFELSWMMDIKNLFENQLIILNQFQKKRIYWRKIFNTFVLNNKITGIVGPRGVGKTTFLLHTALSNGALEGQALFISADHIYFLEHSILDLVDQLYKETEVKLLCIDEIHKQPNWQQVLKNIADIYGGGGFKILFTGSSVIDIVYGKIDLSRRVTLHELYGFSFREYLEFYLDISLPVIENINTLFLQHTQLAQDLISKMPSNFLWHFKKYLTEGYYPFYSELETTYEKAQATHNMALKTIYEDIAILHALKTPSLLVIEQLYKYSLSMTSGELNINKLANALNKDFSSVETYLNFLVQAGLLQFLYAKQIGKGVLKKPVKFYPENTNLIYASFLNQPPENFIGQVRETFVMNQMKILRQSIFYSEIGDFQIEDFLLEVGGKNKTTKQLQAVKNQNQNQNQNKKQGYVLADGILTGLKNTVPLYLLGFLS